VKKRIILICLIFLLSQVVFAQESAQNVISIGIGPEFNMNSRENFAGGFVVSIDYKLPISAIQLAAGLTMTTSFNFSDALSFEVTGMVRWYFLRIKNLNFFAQADAGMHLIVENNISVVLIEGGLRAGLRMPIGDLFYIEPYGRFGYPYAWGMGVLAGVRINIPSKKNTVSNIDSIQQEEE